MNKMSVVTIGVIVMIGAIGFAVWWMKPDITAKAPAPAPPVKTETPAPPPTPPPPAEESPKPEATVVEETPVTPPPQVQERFEEAGEQPFEGVPITEETLTGCKYREGRLEIEFAANHVWKVNGNDRARWMIEGNRVKIYNKPGTEFEVHYVDIQGDRLVFNGEPIALWK